MRIALFVLLAIASVSAVQFSNTTDCATYCNLVAATPICGGFTGMGFRDANGCLAVCSALASSVNPNLGNQSYDFAGQINATSGNTMACRLYHLQVANSSNSLFHCSHASLHGNLTCGATPIDYCGTYCVLQGAFCSENYAVGAGAFNPIYCATQCLGLQYTSNLVMPHTQAGDNINCRLYHAGAAYDRQAVPGSYVHCAHSSYLGGNVCGNNATAQAKFCAGVALTCGTKFPYSSPAHCLSDSVTYDATNIGNAFGSVNGSSGDTLACRAYHGSTPSFVDGTTHCPHAGFSTGGVCGNRAATTQPVTTTSAPSSASSFVVSVFVVLAALLVALF